MTAVRPSWGVALLLAAALGVGAGAGCGESAAPAGQDAAPARDAGAVQPVVDGTYAVEWVSDDGLGLGACDRLTLARETAELAFFTGDEPCAGPLARAALDSCACYPGPVEDTRRWCLCPGVGRLIGQIHWTDGRLAAELHAIPDGMAAGADE